MEGAHKEGEAKERGGTETGEEGKAEKWELDALREGRRKGGDEEERTTGGLSENHTTTRVRPRRPNYDVSVSGFECLSGEKVPSCRITRGASRCGWTRGQGASRRGTL